MSLGSLKERTKIKVRIDENSRMNKAPNVTLLLEGITLFRVCPLFCFDMQSYPEGIPFKRNLFLICTWMLASLFAFL